MSHALRTSEAMNERRQNFLGRTNGILEKEALQYTDWGDKNVANNATSNRRLYQRGKSIEHWTGSQAN